MAKKRSNDTPAPAERRLGPLIDRLGPINNACRSADGIDKVELLWDLGDAVLSFDPEASDEVLWLISDRSYITRDLLRYGLIIRRAWPDRSDLRRTFPELKSYSLFRAALPFLKGNRCGITDADYQGILVRLRRRATQETKLFLQGLKRKNIGRAHKKGKAVAKMGETAAAVRKAIGELLDLAGADVTRIADARRAIGADGLLVLSQWCMAVAEDSSIPETRCDHFSWPEPFVALGRNLRFVNATSRDERAGFRKAVGPVTLMEAADLLNALRSDERLQHWNQRRRLHLNV